MPGHQLAKVLENPIIKKIQKKEKKITFYRQYLGCSSYWYAIESKFNIGFRFLLCVIDIYSKVAWVISLKDEKWIGITYASHKI